jgi:hypothetical protein
MSLAPGLLAAQPAVAGTIVDSGLTDAYHYVDHYEILIDAPPVDVWPHLMDFRGWMYDFSMTHVSGPRGGEGEVLRLYGNDEYLLEVVKVIPNRLVVAVNLPSSVAGEESVGIGMFTLAEIEGGTLVTNWMSRQFTGADGAPNPLRARRASDEFKETTRAMWEDRFLPRLKELAEQGL